MPKRGHLWPIWWKGKSSLTKQLFINHLGSFLTSKSNSVEKNWVEKHIHTIVFMFGAKINKFAQFLEFFSNTFCLFDFFCQTQLCKNNRKKADEKEATHGGRPQPSIFHPNSIFCINFEFFYHFPPSRIVKSLLAWKSDYSQKRPF